jgi:hypothetical protein
MVLAFERLPAMRAAAGRALPVAGAAGAQFSQAAGSFVVSVLSMRQPDVTVFTTLSLLLGTLVVATSISTGLVGDPLTVLDRHDPATRTALWRLSVAVVCLASASGAVVTVACGLVDVGSGLLFGGLVAVWVFEDLLRRLLMACLLFWRVVAVDLTHLVTVICVLEVVGLNAHRPPDLRTFLIALTCGQVAASGLALAGLPAGERYLGQVTPGRLGRVLGYGGNRALQGLLRPAVLLAMRVAVLAACGTSALAGLETGRIVTAPALLLVSGGGAYLLSRYAVRMRGRSVGGRAHADRAAVLLAVVTVASTVGVLAAAGVFPQVFASSADHQAGWSALSGWVGVWGGYVLAVGVAMPYAALGAVVLPQTRLLRARLLDTMVQVVVGAALLVLAPSAWGLLPLLIGAASALVTGTVLRPLVGVPSPPASQL